MAEPRCCNEYNCRRSQPIKIRRSTFGREWVAITRWDMRGENGIHAIERHTLGEDSVAMIEHEVVSQVVSDLTARVKELRSVVAQHVMDGATALDLVLDLLENGPAETREETA